MSKNCQGMPATHTAYSQLHKTLNKKIGYDNIYIFNDERKPLVYNFHRDDRSVYKNSDLLKQNLNNKFKDDSR